MFLLPLNVQASRAMWCSWAICCPRAFMSDRPGAWCSVYNALREPGGRGHEACWRHASGNTIRETSSQAFRTLTRHLARLE